ncbi:MAG: hypothetical protein H7138_16780 [Myxococcales bacterium]|nr:hypothetical protein [Myxococcales bacterium]
MGSFKDLSKLRGLAEAGLKVRTASEQQQDRREDEIRKKHAVQEEAAAKVLANVPRYPWARAGTLAEARALLVEHQLAFSIAGRGEIEAVIDIEALVAPVQIADGDVALDELVLPGEGSALYVRGDLTVGKRVVQRFRAGTLIVFGSLRAQHVITTGQILVLGDLHVAGTLYGNSTNYATIVLGETRIGTMIAAKQHLVSPLGAYTIGALVDPDGDAPNFEIFARTAPRSPRGIDPEIGHAQDASAIAEALATRDSVLAPV